MCDPVSLMSAGADIFGGVASNITAKGRAAYAEGIGRANALFALAETRSQQAILSREQGEAVKSNMAAIAMSGLSAGSFDGLLKGNNQVVQRRMGEMERTGQGEAARSVAQGNMEALMARMEGKAALLAGISSAGMTLLKAEQSYNQNKLGSPSGKGSETRAEYFKRSWGSMGWS